MGVTIHFEGKLKDLRSLADALTFAAKFSEERAWPFHTIDQPEVTLKRIRNEQDWAT